MIKRLRAKFIVIVMVLITITLAIIFGMVLHFTKKDLRDQSMQMMERAALEEMEPQRPGSMPPKISLPYFVVEFSHDGTVTVRGSDHFDLSDADMMSELLQTAYHSHAPTGEIPEYQLRYFRTSAPFATVIVFADISGETETIGSLLRNCLLIGAAVLVLFFCISFMLARWAVRPVEEAWQHQRQFVADASHELKTPLTVIMTNAELLCSDKFGEGEQRKFKESILMASRQMRGLVETLLDLARLDSDTALDFNDSLDFSELVDDILLSFEALYYERGLTLQAAVAPGIFVTGIRQYLYQVVEILLENAGKYAVKNGEVRVTLQQSGRNHCLLCVENDAEYMKDEDIQLMFKRFYRRDYARSMRGSYGLGLSIAESVVRKHKGRIWADYIDGRIRFFVSLSTASGAAQHSASSQNS